MVRPSTFILNMNPSKKTHLKKAGPKAQLPKTNPRARGKILNLQIKQQPIQEVSFQKKLGRRPSFKRQIQELVVRSLTLRLFRNPSKKTH